MSFLKDKAAPVPFVHDIIANLKPGCVWTTTMSLEKFEDCCVAYVTIESSEDTAIRSFYVAVRNI